MPLAHKLKAVWEKNGPEIRAILLRRTPPFLRNRPVPGLGPRVPVFVFHSVEPQRFESQLRYLAENGYSTLTADELERALRSPPPAGHKQIALTFDDATGSFWAVAYPLLKKYGFKAILFVIAGLVPDDETVYPNLNDVWAGDAGIEDVCGREARQPLCTWRELVTMHRSGVVDVQSHSLTHAKVPVSDEAVDFVSPRFDPCFFGHVDLPLCAIDDPEAPARLLRPGAPVYHSVPRLAGVPGRFADDGIARNLIQYVERHGAERFFEKRGWRLRLNERLEMARKESESPPAMESRAESAAWMRREFEMSRQRLEDRIAGLCVRHFCYPWFRGCQAADALAAECGYSAVHYGFELPHALDSDAAQPIRIRRYSEEYVGSLPGKGRQWPYTVWLSRLRALAARAA